LRVPPSVIRVVASPLVAYVRRFPVKRGKGIVLHRLLRPLLSLLGEVELAVPPHGRVWLSASETLGLYWMVYGPFEEEERKHAARVAATGGWAIDVGANVGVFTVSIGQSLRTGAKLIAVEPLQDNIDRLRRHLQQSDIADVSIVKAAVGASPGRAVLMQTPDAAYSSLAGNASVGSKGVEVAVTTLDDIWESHGSPDVTFVKIDIEGAEVEALKGARRMLAALRPELLIEIDDKERVAVIEDLLRGLGYRRHQPVGFEPWNHVFTATQT
jgi:FkbM family methyltransferase